MLKCLPLKSSSKPRGRVPPRHTEAAAASVAAWFSCHRVDKHLSTNQTLSCIPQKVITQLLWGWCKDKSLSRAAWLWQSVITTVQSNRFVIWFCSHSLTCLSFHFATQKNRMSTELLHSVFFHLKVELVMFWWRKAERSICPQAPEHTGSRTRAHTLAYTRAQYYLIPWSVPGLLSVCSFVLISTEMLLQLLSSPKGVSPSPLGPLAMFGLSTQTHTHTALFLKYFVIYMTVYLSCWLHAII